MMRRILAAVAVIVIWQAASAGAQGIGAQGVDNNNLLNDRRLIVNDMVSLYFVCRDEGVTADTFMAENEPPLLKDYSITPENPAPGEIVSVWAEIYNKPELTLSRTISAYFHYSTDGGRNWKRIDMDMAAPGEEYGWQAEFRAPDDPGTVMYFFTAVDDENNYYMEVPELNIEWAARDETQFPDVMTDENDLMTLVPDDMDILSASIGYDGEYAYFASIVEGGVSGGTASPMEVHVYTVGFYPPNTGSVPVFTPTHILGHTQLGRIIGFPIVGLLDVSDGAAEEVASAKAEYHSERNHLHMRVLKSSISGADEGHIRIVFGTALGVGCSPLSLSAMDTSGFVNLVFGHREIEVR